MKDMSCEAKKVLKEERARAENRSWRPYDGYENTKGGKLVEGGGARGDRCVAAAVGVCS